MATELNTAKSTTDKKVKLKIDNVSLSFGGVRALTDISVDVRENEILAIYRSQRGRQDSAVKLY